MMHNTCGARCMVDGVCSKNFPKPYCDVSSETGGYPTYRRRSPADGGVTATVNVNTKDGVIQYIRNNSRVVPYNPYLLLLFNCHINVEVSTNITAVKYLFKYVYKGEDSVVATIIGSKDDSKQRKRSVHYVAPSFSVYLIHVLLLGNHTTK